MKIKNKTYSFIVLMLIPFSFLMQFFLVPHLPDKYFYDSLRILSLTNGSANLADFDSSYLFAGNFFIKVNFLNFTTFFQWSILLTLISIPFIFLFLKKYKNVKIDQLFFILVTITFFNIYIPRISKDFIQFAIWSLIYIVLKSKIKNSFKIIITVIIFIIEAKLFRTYYLAIGLLFVLVYLYLKSKKNHLKLGRMLVITFVSMFVVLLIVQKYMPSIYNRVINLRADINFGREGSEDANTAINDLFNNNSPIIYCVNYFVNLFRILFPFELILKGVKYIPFIIYQVYFSIMLIKKLTMKKKKKDYLLISVLIAYILISNLFEPDFGSLIRHEVALLFIMIDILIGGYKNEKVLKIC